MTTSSPGSAHAAALIFAGFLAVMAFLRELLPLFSYTADVFRGVRPAATQRGHTAHDCGLRYLFVFHGTELGREYIFTPFFFHHVSGLSEERSCCFLEECFVLSVRDIYVDFWPSWLKDLFVLNGRSLTPSATGLCKPRTSTTNWWIIRLFFLRVCVGYRALDQSI